MDQPSGVALPGDFEPFLTHAEIWSPDIDAVQMTFDSARELWTLGMRLPAGLYHYKVAINRSWEENYGMFGVPYGTDVELDLLADGEVVFEFDYATKHVDAIYQGDTA